MFRPFHAFGPSHWVVLAATALLLGLLLFARRRDHAWSRSLEIALGWAVFSAHFINVAGWWWTRTPLGWHNAAPMHLCNWAGIAVWIALVFRKPLAAELAWFWSMTGTIHGLLTPNQTYDWPNPTFAGFFLLHGGVIIGAVHAVFGMDMKPRPGAWWRGILWTQGYVLAATAVNLASGANYAFLAGKPANPSLMDHLGPWPWYLLSIHLLGAVIITLLYLPFRPRRTPA